MGRHRRHPCRNYPTGSGDVLSSGLCGVPDHVGWWGVPSSHTRRTLNAQIACYTSNGRSIPKPCCRRFDSCRGHSCRSCPRMQGRSDSQLPPDPVQTPGSDPLACFSDASSEGPRSGRPHVVRAGGSRTYAPPLPAARVARGGVGVVVATVSAASLRSRAATRCRPPRAARPAASAQPGHRWAWSTTWRMEPRRGADCWSLPARSAWSISSSSPRGSVVTGRSHLCSSCDESCPMTSIRRLGSATKRGCGAPGRDRVGWPGWGRQIR